MVLYKYNDDSIPILSIIKHENSFKFVFEVIFENKIDLSPKYFLILSEFLDISCGAIIYLVFPL